MEKAKSKKKLIAIIAGAAMAFVLTVVVSVAATLAYFGQSADGTTSVKMGGSVLVGATVTDSTNLENLIPGQKVDLQATANVTSSTTQDACLLAVVTLTDTNSKGITTEDLAKFGNVDTSKWVEVGTAGTGKVYMYGAENDATVIAATSSATPVTLFTGNVTIPTTWDNDMADAEIGIAVTFIATQLPVDAQGAPIEDNITYAQLMPIAQSLVDDITLA